jgi:hypothetical protein
MTSPPALFEDIKILEEKVKNSQLPSDLRAKATSMIEFVLHRVRATPKNTIR